MNVGNRVAPLRPSGGTSPPAIGVAPEVHDGDHHDAVLLDLINHGVGEAPGAARRVRVDSRGHASGNRVIRPNVA